LHLKFDWFADIEVWYLIKNRKELQTAAQIKMGIFYE